MARKLCRGGGQLVAHSRELLYLHGSSAPASSPCLADTVARLGGDARGLVGLPVRLRVAVRVIPADPPPPRPRAGAGAPAARAVLAGTSRRVLSGVSLIHISEPTRLGMISY